MSWRVARWTDVEGLIHGFGGREDGEAPAEAPGLRTLRQVHGNDVVEVAALDDSGARGDALITRPGLPPVAVKTADCVPVLLVAPAARFAAAVHSGWRGTVAGVADATIEHLRERHGIAPRDLKAAIGPAIDGCCYEVGEEVREAFVNGFGDAGRVGFREKAGGRPHLDLRDFLVGHLAALGVDDVERVGPCTACRHDLLHSYRRERSSGRQVSWIGWR